MTDMTISKYKSRNYYVQCTCIDLVTRASIKGCTGMDLWAVSKAPACLAEMLGQPAQLRRRKPVAEETLLAMARILWCWMLQVQAPAVGSI